MNVFVYLRDSRVVPITGCTGNPTEIDIPVSSGYFRDQFTLESNVTGLMFTGEGGDPVEAQNIQVPAATYGRIVPTGPITITRATVGATSAPTVAGFAVALSDEVAHEPLRQASYIESHWAFPVDHDGVIMNMMFRKAEVVGWGNVEPDN